MSVNRYHWDDPWSTLNWHSLNISFDTQSTLNQHLGQQSINSLLIFANMPMSVVWWVGQHSANYDGMIDPCCHIQNLFKAAEKLAPENKFRLEFWLLISHQLSIKCQPDWSWPITNWYVDRASIKGTISINTQSQLS